MLAFNRDIKRDIEEKADAATEVATMNAFGFRALCGAFGRLDVDSDYAWALFRADFGDDTVSRDATYFGRVKKLYDLCRSFLASTTDEAAEIAVTYEVEFTDDDGTDRAEEAYAYVLGLMARRADRSTPVVGIDFLDQLWLPVARKLPMPKYDVVVLDEAQDTAPVQVAMLEGCADRGARIIAVGDRRQAIYQFRGADEYAVDNIVEAFDMKILPLMTTFRCGKAIVAEAAAIVPAFVSGPNNHEGTVRGASIAAMMAEAKPGDFVISRSNAPLISGCIAMLARGVRAAVVGRDVGKDLLALAKKFRAKTMEEFLFRLDQWKAQQLAKLAVKVPTPESAIEAVNDKHACLEALGRDVASVADLYARCETLFVDDPSAARVDFTSTHKAKGRERDRVWLLRDTFCKSRRGAEVKEEEYNLLYVAITRAKHELVYVSGEVGR
jgi:superfamily I DNA/RNA helicase